MKRRPAGPGAGKVRGQWWESSAGEVQAGSQTPRTPAGEGWAVDVGGPGEAAIFRREGGDLRQGDFVCIGHRAGSAPGFGRPRPCRAVRRKWLGRFRRGTGGPRRMRKSHLPVSGLGTGRRHGLPRWYTAPYPAGAVSRVPPRHGRRRPQFRRCCGRSVRPHSAPPGAHRR